MTPSERSPKITVIIPALNEEASIGKVIADLPKDLIDQIIVGDNGSTDRTAEVANAAGATVVSEPRKGYGWACMAAMRVASGTDIILFIDGDYSDYPEQAREVLEPLFRGEADLVIGSRVLGDRQPGALLPQARFGNWLATILVRWLFGVKFTDLGPFRAIWARHLEAMEMQEMTFGWTVEMQIKAARMGLRCVEVPVRYRKRVGQSKVTGTLKGTILAGFGILRTIALYGLMPATSHERHSAQKD